MCSKVLLLVGRHQQITDALMLLVFEVEVSAELLEASENELVESQNLLQCHCILTTRQLPHAHHCPHQEIQAAQAQRLARALL